MKKFLAAILTIAMVASLSVPVLATYTSSASAGGDYTGETFVPMLSLLINYYGSGSAGPTATNKLVLNPFGVKVKSTTNTGTGTAGWLSGYSDGTTDQVLASPINVSSKTTSGVNIICPQGATSTKAGNLELATKAPTKATQNPTAYLYMCATAGSGTHTVADIASIEWPSYDKNSCWLFSDSATSKDIVLYTIPATDGTNASEAWVGITGSLSTEVAENGNDWASTDKVDVSNNALKFTFALTAE